MPDHQTPLITTIAAGLVLAYAFGLLAHRLRVQPLVGYLFAGVLVGPFTPGFIADQGLASELAEIGIILLMFGVGLHFSLKDLVSVARVAVPGALGRIVAATGMGMALAWALGWGIGAGVVFGLALSVASTVVLVRALQERRMLDTERGRIAVGWVVVEDLAMILALVLLPALAEATREGAPSAAGPVALSLAFTLAKVGAFVAVMLVGGRRVIPWLMHYTAHTGSRELFRLAVYAIALGVAFAAAKLFGASFALGAFFAGMVLGESRLSQRATEEAMPLRDAFAVLFFVSVGMLFNPRVLTEAPLAVLATVAVIVLGKSVAAFGIIRAFGYSRGTALTVSAGLAQIGEFSFILAGLGVASGLLPEEARDLILAGSIISIMLNPFAFALAALRPRRSGHTASPPLAAEPARSPAPVPAVLAAPTTAPDDAEAPAVTALVDHDVVVGYGRVGSLVGAGLVEAGRPVLVFEDHDDQAEAARRGGAEVVSGNAADPLVLAAANLPAARRLFVTIPEAFEAGQVVEQARAANPALVIMARAHSMAAVEHLGRLGATLTISGEREIAHRMLESAFEADDAPAEMAEAGGGAGGPLAAQQRAARPSANSSRQAP